MSAQVQSRPEDELDEPTFVANSSESDGHSPPADSDARSARHMSLRNRPIAAQMGAIVVAFGTVVVFLLALMAASNRLTTAGRAYMEGDRQWTHAQDQAIYRLAMYLNSGQEADYLAFREHLEIPLALRFAREELGRPSFDRARVERALLEGGIDARDVSLMIWAFRQFHDVGPLAQANRAWAEGDILVEELLRLGSELHAEVLAGHFDPTRRSELVGRLNQINRRIGSVEARFAAKVSDSARWVQQTSLYAVLVAGLLLFAIAVQIAWRIFRHLSSSVRALGDAADRIARGDLTRAVPVRSRDELGQLSRAFNDMMLRRQQVETALNQERESLKNVLENTRAVPWEFDLQTTTCTYIGPQVERQWGWLPACFAHPHFLFDCIHPDDRGILGNALERIRHTAELEVEFRLCRSDGRFMHIRSLLSGGGAGDAAPRTMRALSIDVTSQVELDKQLRMLNNLIEQMGLPFVSGDREGRILRANAAFASLTGYCLDELLEMRTSSLTPERWREQDAERFRQMRITGRGMHGEKEYQRKDGTLVPITFYSEPYRNANGELEGLYAFVTDQTVSKRKAEEVERIQSALRESEERLRAAFEYSAIGIILVDPDGQPIRANHAVCRILGYTEEEFRRSDRRRTTHPDDIEREEVLRRQLLAGEIPSFTLERRQFHKDGHVLWVRSTVTAARNAAGSLLHLIYEIEDITDRKQAEAGLQAADEQNRKLELELRHAQKLEAVGRLASGVAHEINTPVQFVSDSCHFLRDGLADLQTLLGTYRGSLEAVAEGRLAVQAALDQAREAEQILDVDYLLENLPSAADRSLQGLERVATIVRSMKEFAHPDRKDKVDADLNQAILSTLTIARNEYKYVADVETDLGALPPVCCLVSEFNQAILNLVVNAAHAIGDAVQGSDRRGRIRIRTRYEAPYAVIAIEDDGAGIPESIRDKIFDPFFTTKEIGKGTGQGLAIVRSVIVNKHQGMISVQSMPGQGTTFVLRLPAEAARPAQELAA